MLSTMDGPTDSPPVAAREAASGYSIPAPLGSREALRAIHACGRRCSSIDWVRCGAPVRSAVSPATMRFASAVMW
jgi:hypothetical protein